MKKTILTKISIVALATFAAATFSAQAYNRSDRDKRDDRHKRYDRHSKHHHHHSHGVKRSNRWRPAPLFVPAPVVVSRPVVVQRPVYMSHTEAAVQRELARRGYYRGIVDGQVGPQTRASIRAYQIDRGLPVTGVIDAHLLRSLRLV